MNRLSEAICYATELFDGKYRKGEHYPAIFHSLEASSIVLTVTEDEDVACAAILHDTVEDAGATIDGIRERFGERVAFLVNAETEKKYPEKNPTDTWLLRKERSLEVLKQSDDMGVKTLWLGDKLSNMRSFSRMYDKLGDKMWEMFHQKDKNQHKQYYQIIAKELAVFENTSAYQEYIALVKKVFGE